MNLADKLADLSPFEQIRVLAGELQAVIERAGWSLAEQTDLLEIDRLVADYGVSKASLLNRISRAGKKAITLDGKAFVRRPVWLEVLLGIESGQETNATAPRKPRRARKQSAAV